MSLASVWTAYEIHSGDWSSDVCSSDLPRAELGNGTQLSAKASLTYEDRGRGQGQVETARGYGRHHRQVGGRFVEPYRTGGGHKQVVVARSEERRVGEEGRSRWSPDH